MSRRCPPYSLSVHVHTAILDAVVIGGGAAMIINAFAR
jgi:hypothetical protein